MMVFGDGYENQVSKATHRADLFNFSLVAGVMLNKLWACVRRLWRNSPFHNVSAECQAVNVFMQSSLKQKRSRDWNFKATSSKSPSIAASARGSDHSTCGRDKSFMVAADLDDTAVGMDLVEISAESPPAAAASWHSETPVPQDSGGLCAQLVAAPEFPPGPCQRSNRAISLKRTRRKETDKECTS